jgi:hypothetical protein
MPHVDMSARSGTPSAFLRCAPSRRSVADGSADRLERSSGAMSEHVGASRTPDGLQSEQANLQVEQARMMLG